MIIIIVIIIYIYIVQNNQEVLHGLHKNFLTAIAGLDTSACPLARGK